VGRLHRLVLGVLSRGTGLFGGGLHRVLGGVLDPADRLLDRAAEVALEVARDLLGLVGERLAVVLELLTGATACGALRTASAASWALLPATSPRWDAFSCTVPPRSDALSCRVDAPEPTASRA
jgi:hypothetical protein